MDFNASHYSVFYLIMFFGIYFILKFQRHGSNLIIGNGFLALLSFLFSVAVVTGFYFDHGLPFEKMAAGDWVHYFVCTVGLMPLAEVLFGWIYGITQKWAVKESNAIKWQENGIVIFGISFCVVFGCWLLVWLAYYPGFWNYDPNQVWQFINKDYKTHHPLLHTVLLGACYSTGMDKSNSNSGLILYEMIQMLIMAGIFSYTYVYLCKKISDRIFRGLTLLFYAVFPVNSILAISTTKDVLFSGLVLLCMVLSLQAAEAAPGRRRNIVLVLLLFVCTNMLLFRNNAIYAFALMIGYVLVNLLVHRDRLSMKVLFYVMGCLLAFVIANTMLEKGLHAEKGSIKEMFSVPSQQFGRIYDIVNASGSDMEALELIERYHDMDKSWYNPHLADSMKNTLDIEKNGTVLEYLKNSAGLFWEYPVISIDSFLYLTEGSWNLQDTSHACIYGSGLEERQGYLLTDMRGDYGFVHESKFPRLELLLEEIVSNNAYQNWPVASLIFTPAFYVWIMVICIVGFICTKSRYYGIIISFLCFLFITLLAGPCVLVRYFYPFYVCGPVMVCMLNVSMRGKDDAKLVGEVKL